MRSLGQKMKNDLCTTTTNTITATTAAAAAGTATDLTKPLIFNARKWDDHKESPRNVPLGQVAGSSPHNRGMWFHITSKKALTHLSPPSILRQNSGFFKSLRNRSFWFRDERMSITMHIHTVYIYNDVYTYIHVYIYIWVYIVHTYIYVCLYTVDITFFALSSVVFPFLSHISECIVVTFSNLSINDIEW